MIKDDSLWKGILENVFDDFLFFFFKDAENLFDMEKGFQFLDKELEQLFPTAESEAPKFVDKLVKVFRRSGNEEWMLIHVEVQGYNDKNFAMRMFVYFYRILDKYGMPITAIAIFTDTNKQFHPKAFEYENLGTKNIYMFNTYKVIEQNEEVLKNSENPFAVVILTVLVALKKKNLSDEDLLKLKVQIFRNLYRRKIDERKMRGLQTFLNLYVHFAKPETNSKFEKAIQLITDNKNTMGIEEMVLERARKKGLKEGRQEGLKEGLQEGLQEGLKLGLRQAEEKKNYEFVKNLLLETNFSVTKIAALANVAEAFVLEIKKNLH